jgi:uncharacterized membrane protein
MKNFIYEIIDLSVLIIILGIGVYTFVMLRSNQAAQLVIGVVIAIAYAVWGIMHHRRLGNLHRKVMVEYVLISAIAVTMLLIVLGN